MSTAARGEGEVGTPMDPARFRKIKAAAERRGILIQQGADIDRHLAANGAEGATFNAYTILLRCNPSASAVFEELIHAAQYRQGLNDGSPESALRNEIEAQRKLIRNQRIYGISDAENEQTIKILSDYERRLSDLLSRR